MADSAMTSRQSALDITRRLQMAHFEAFWAGGCVRDHLLGVEPKDYDVATSAKPQEIKALFPRSQTVGAAFGVVIVHHHGQTTEVATFRTDGTYSDGRRPDTIQFASAQEDANRRDFTINGMFFDPIRAVLVDYVGGQMDVANRLIRAIGNPRARFAEDHLRMMRAIRFASRLNFDIESTTSDAIYNLHEKIKLISRERIGVELKGILATAHRTRGVSLLFSSGLLADIWPANLQAGVVNQWAANNGWLIKLPPNAAFEISLAALVHDLSEHEANDQNFWPKLQSHFMLSNDEISSAAWITHKMGALPQWTKLSRSELKRLMAHDYFPLLEELYFYVHDDVPLRHYLTELKAEGVKPEPFITGEDLIAMGAQPGPNFKEWLNLLYDQQLANMFADRRDALVCARKLVADKFRRQ
jgi:poly(A) polymerase